MADPHDIDRMNDEGGPPLDDDRHDKVKTDLEELKRREAYISPADSDPYGERTGM